MYRASNHTCGPAAEFAPYWIKSGSLRGAGFGASHHAAYGTSERVVLDFRGPHNRALLLRPARMT
jgi:hypothetical protein